MKGSNVIFKGMKDGLVIMLKEGPEFEELLKELEDKLASSVNFLKGINFPVKVGGRKLSPEEFNLVAQKVRDFVGLEIIVETEEIKDKTDLKKNDSQTELRSYFYGIDEGMTKFHKGTLRSGQIIKYHGNIVIIGDANPGSQIIASGNVVVLGTLRGIVHAGATGNREAVVVAFNLRPTQLRIADIITRPPEEFVTKAAMPEIAYIKDDIIVIEYYLPKI